MVKGLFSTIFAIWFTVWLLLAPDVQGKLERTCSPVGWLGGVVVSFTMLTGLDDFTPATQKFFDKFEYGCRYSLWRLMYEKDYLEATGKDKKQGEGE